MLIARPTANDTSIRAAVQAAGGSISGVTGLIYAINVTPGSEQAFIAALLTNAGVLGVWPDSPAASKRDPATLRIVDTNDDTSGCNGVSHAQAVEAIGGSNNLTQWSNSNRSIAEALQAALPASGHDDAPVVINISAGPEKESPQENLAFFSELADVLNNQVSLDGIVLVVSAGNEGINLNEGGVLRKFFDQHPELAGHFVLVGSSGSPDDCAEDHTHAYSDQRTASNGDPFFGYAPAKNVPVPGLNCPEGVSGTSFAAPQYAKDLKAALDSAPDNAKVADVVKQFLNEHPLDCTPPSLLKGNKLYNCTFTYNVFGPCTPDPVVHSGTCQFLYNSNPGDGKTNRRCGIFLNNTGSFSSGYLGDNGCNYSPFPSISYTTPAFNIASSALAIPDGSVQPDVDVIGRSAFFSQGVTVQRRLTFRVNQNGTTVTGSFVQNGGGVDNFQLDFNGTVQ
ncbi:MAG: S8/S53 family peptidase [Vulcanimicrobiota bacterium]